MAIIHFILDMVMGVLVHIIHMEAGVPLITMTIIRLGILTIVGTLHTGLLHGEAILTGEVMVDTMAIHIAVLTEDITMDTRRDIIMQM